MSCWCEQVKTGDPRIKYYCIECERKMKWDSLQDLSKVKLIKYQKLLDSNNFNQEFRNLSDWLHDRNLCVSMIPDEKLSI